MTSFATSYAQQMLKHFGFYANWTPFNRVSLGDIGYIKNGLFERKASLNDAFNIGFGKRLSNPETTLKNHLMFSTSGSTEVALLAKGAAGLAHCGLDISFKNKNSFFVNLAGVHTEEIEDQVTLGRQILRLFFNDQWKSDWVVVTSTVHAAASIILGAMEGNHSCQLESRVDVPEINLSDVKLDLSLKKASALDLHIICEQDLTPFLGLSRIRKKWLGDATFNFSEDQDADISVVKKNVQRLGLEPNVYFEFASLAPSTGSQIKQ